MMYQQENKSFLEDFIDQYDDVAYATSFQNAYYFFIFVTFLLMLSGDNISYRILEVILSFLSVFRIKAYIINYETMKQPKYEKYRMISQTAFIVSIPGLAWNLIDFVSIISTIGSTVLFTLGILSYGISKKLHFS